MRYATRLYLRIGTDSALVTARGDAVGTGAVRFPRLTQPYEPAPGAYRQAMSSVAMSVTAESVWW